MRLKVTEPLLEQTNRKQNLAGCLCRLWFSECCRYVVVQTSELARGGELGVLRVREHPLVAKSTLSILNKNFIEHFIILRSNKNTMFEVRIRANPW